jgi:hypothetical protein
VFSRNGSILLVTNTVPYISPKLVLLKHVATVRRQHETVWFLSLYYNHQGNSHKTRIMPTLKTYCMLNKHYLMDKLQHNGSGTKQTFEHIFLVDQKCCSKTINNLQRIPFQLFVGDRQTCHQALTVKAAFQFTKLATDARTNGLLHDISLPGNSHCSSYCFTWQHMVKAKVNVTLEQAKKAQRWSRGIALPFL